MPEERPLSIDVPLRDGRTVTIGELRWGVYKPLKRKVADVAASRLTPEVVVDAIATAKSDDPLHTGAQAFGVLGTLLLEIIDELTPLIVQGCTATELDFDNLPAVDVLRLREAAATTTDLEAVLGLEGNALAAAAKRLVSLTAVRGGGSRLKEQSPELTDGVSLK